MIMSSYFNVPVFAPKNYKDLCWYCPKPHFARGVSKILEGSVYVLNTTVSAADSLDSSFHQRVASLLNFVGHCYSVPALSGVRGLNSELNTNNHSLPLFHHTARHPTDGSKQSHYLQTYRSSTKTHQHYGRLSLLFLLYVLNTSVSAADSLDSSVHQRADSLLNLVGHCYSVPALSGVRGLNSELKTNNHSLPLSPYTQTTYRWIKTVSLTTNTQIIYKHTSTLWPADCTFSLICS